MLFANRQVVLVLCGVVGSGKSTFATALQKAEPSIIRCNQDDLGGDRRNVEALVQQTLASGKSVCIDRTNIDVKQRRNWINFARQMNVEAWCVVLDTPYEVCKDRLLQRTDHPTIKTPEAGVEILSKFALSYIPPTMSEGFHFLLKVVPNATPSYEPTDIERILQAWELAASPLPDLKAGPLPRLTMEIENDGSPRSFSGRGRGWFPPRRQSSTPGEQQHGFRGGSARGRGVPGGGGRGNTLSANEKS